jgi:hypothetical protein
MTGLWRSKTMKNLKRFMALMLLLALALPAQADTLTSAVNVAVQATLAKTGTLSTPKDILSKAIQKEFANGTGSGQADKIFRDQRTLTTGQTEDLDLAGVLTDPFGAIVTFAKVKVIMIENLSTARTLTVGGASTFQFVNWVGGATHTINIPPGGFFAISAPAAGFAVTAGTGDLLKIANDAGSSCIYNIIIIGTSS